MLGLKLTRYRVLLALAIFGMALVGIYLDQGEKMIEKNSIVGQAQTRTICIGRFLLDVPMDATIVYGPARVPQLIERYRDSAQDIGKFETDFMARLENTRYLADGDLVKPESMLGKAINGARTGQKILFGVGEGSGDFYDLESLIPLGKDLFVQTTSAHGTAREYGNAVAKLNATAMRLRSRTEDEIPVEAGVCIDGGFIPDYDRTNKESVTMGIRLHDHDDVHISIELTKKDTVFASDGLERRLAAGKENAIRRNMGGWYSQIREIRRGPRIINKWHGYEILARKPAQPGENESHEFSFVSLGDAGNALLPTVEITLQTGVVGDSAAAMKPSVSDLEAVAIWDSIIRTLRRRAVK